MYPIIGDSSEITDIKPLYDNDVNLDDTENNNLGMMQNFYRDVICADKIIINTVLNKELVCGKCVNMKLPSYSSNISTENSLRFSGKYIIESSYHIWDGKNARTTLVCSKPSVNLTDNYRNKNLLFK